VAATAPVGGGGGLLRRCVAAAAADLSSDSERVRPNVVAAVFFCPNAERRGGMAARRRRCGAPRLAVIRAKVTAVTLVGNFLLLSWLASLAGKDGGSLTTPWRGQRSTILVCGRGSPAPRRQTSCCYPRRVGHVLASASACCCYQRSLLLAPRGRAARAHPRVLASLALRAGPDGGGVGPAGGGDDAEDQDRVAAPGHDPPAGVRGGQGSRRAYCRASWPRGPSRRFATPPGTGRAGGWMSSFRTRRPAWGLSARPPMTPLEIGTFTIAPRRKPNRP